MDFRLRLFEHFTRITKALGSGSRLRVLELLAQGERSVESLSAVAGMSVANTSQHLQRLRHAGLVLSRKEGSFVYYRVSGGGVVRLLQALGEVAENNLPEVAPLIAQFLTARDETEPVSHDELLQRMRRGRAIVIDVRPPEEFAAAHIAGAVNVPMAELADWMRRARPGREVVAYCRGRYQAPGLRTGRSQAARRFAYAKLHVVRRRDHHRGLNASLERPSRARQSHPPAH